MSLGPNIRYRFKPVNVHEELRLAFKGNKVVEAVPFYRNSQGVLKKRKY